MFKTKTETKTSWSKTKTKTLSFLSSRRLETKTLEDYITETVEAETKYSALQTKTMNSACVYKRTKAKDNNPENIPVERNRL